jgi:hypothetical protein
VPIAAATLSALSGSLRIIPAAGFFEAVDPSYSMGIPNAAEFTMRGRREHLMERQKPGYLMAAPTRLWLTKPAQTRPNQKIQNWGLQVQTIGHRYTPARDEQPVGPV